jgi:hypothetical protein
MINSTFHLTVFNDHTHTKRTSLYLYYNYTTLSTPFFIILHYQHQLASSASTTEGSRSTCARHEGSGLRLGVDGWLECSGEPQDVVRDLYPRLPTREHTSRVTRPRAARSACPVTSQCGHSRPSRRAK